MSPDVQKRLFEPFFTTKDAGEGTGLGLSMVQAIVRQNGGHISVQTAPGKGTTFRIYFPTAADEAAPLRPLVSPRGAAVRGSGVVLLAEDDRSVRRLVVSELTRRGFEVIEAPDGRVALELAHSHEGKIDVLVTDVVMPRMNGADLAKEMAHVRPEVRVLFISGHPERAGAGLDPTGTPNLLMKPFTADTLASRITELVEAGRTWRGSSDRGGRSRFSASASCRCSSRCALPRWGAASSAPAGRFCRRARRSAASSASRSAG
jgi:two-component system cell cycle sensor histidine kinase/response regulator CckA